LCKHARERSVIPSSLLRNSSHWFDGTHLTTPPWAMREHRDQTLSIPDILFGMSSSLKWVDERHILEFLLLLDREKAVVRVPLVGESEWAQMLDFCSFLGLACVGSQQKTVIDFVNGLGEEFVTWAELDDPRDGSRVAYCAWSHSEATAVEEAERNGDNVTVGRFLGYPRCCVDAYETLSDDGAWVERLLHGAPGTALPWEANKLAYALHGASLFPDYFPCSLTCAGTIDLTRRATSALTRHGLSDLVQHHARLMQSPIVVLPDRIVAMDPSQSVSDWRTWAATNPCLPTVIREAGNRGANPGGTEHPYLLTFA
jgi:hypothetical protein